MTQIQKQVHEYLEKNLIIKNALERDLISIRKLARHISEKLKIDRYDAIISAIRRYDKKETKDVYEHARKIVKNTKISTKSDIISIAIEKNNEAQKILPKLFEKIDFSKGEVLRIIQAEEAIKIIIDKKNFEKIEKILPKNIIITIEKNIAEINLNLDKEAVNTPGIISVIFSEMMINNINIMEAISCVPEMLIFVKEKDLLQTYSVLFNLVKE